MHPVDTLLEEYRETAADAVRLIETQPAARLTSRPNPARWSAVECLQHLTLSNQQFAPRVETALTQARLLPTSDGPYKMDFMARILLWTLEPPVRMRFPTSPAFIPRTPQQPADVLQDYLGAHDRLAAMLESGRGLELDKVKIVSPFAEKVTYNVWSTFVVAIAHERRHLWQAHNAVRL